MSARYSGRLLGNAPTRSAVRVVAVDVHSEVVGEAFVDGTGTWSMQPASSVDRFVAVAGGTRVAAIAAPADAAQLLTLPELVPIRVVNRTPASGLALSIDPEELVGFPSELLLVVRTHAAGIVDLHVAEIELTSGDTGLELQRGTYRLSGGRISIHPTLDPGSKTMQLAQIVDARSRRSVADQDGDIRITISEATSLELTFA